MLIKASIYKVTLKDTGKVKAEVALLVSHPDDLIRLRLFESHQKDGSIKTFQELVGQEALVPVEIDQYRGQLQYGLAFGLLPKPYQQDQQKPKRA